VLEAQLGDVIRRIDSFYLKSRVNYFTIPQYQIDADVPIGDGTFLYLLRRRAYYNSVDYQYYRLDSMATDADLVNLLDHSSIYLRTFATYALGFRDTPIISEYFPKILDNGVKFNHKRIDVILADYSPTLLLTSLRQRMKDRANPTQNFINRLEAAYLLHPKTPGEEIAKYLYREQDVSLKPTIVTLAIERGNVPALWYLKRWHKSEYYREINQGLLGALDSNFSLYNINLTKDIIQSLLELDDEISLRELGHWLRENYYKWAGTKGIDELLDRSMVLRDSIYTGVNRYCYTYEETRFIQNHWSILKGINTETLQLSDSIVLQKLSDSICQSCPNMRISNNDGAVYASISGYGKTPYKYLGEVILDVRLKRICLNKKWEWYKIQSNGNQLILIKEP